MAAAEEQQLAVRRRKAVEKPLRGKVQKRTFPLRLEIPQTPRISTLPTASTTTGKHKMDITTRKGDISNVLSMGTFLLSVDTFLQAA